MELVDDRVVWMSDSPPIGIDFLARDIVAFGSADRDSVQVFECLDRNRLDTIGYPRSNEISPDSVCYCGRDERKFVLLSVLMRIDYRPNVPVFRFDAIELALL